MNGKVIDFNSRSPKPKKLWSVCPTCSADMFKSVKYNESECREDKTWFCGHCDKHYARTQ